jgi:stage II sporulation protein E
MLISDCMGSGSGAAVDSAITVDLLSRLIDANVAYDPALKIINSALLVKTGEESLATIDITAVDLYSGRADLYKAGAAPTFVRRHQRTGYVESISLPVGILNAVEFEKSSLQLSAGDMIVMVSDGATTSGLDWIRHTIDRFDSDDLQSLCDDIAATARAKRSDNRDDDITVLAGILRKR